MRFGILIALHIFILFCYKLTAINFKDCNMSKSKVAILRTTSKNVLKDYENLKVLTSMESTGYGYKYGFHLVLGKTLGNSKLKIFQHGEEIAVVEGEK